MAKILRNRLARLEQKRPPAPHPWVVCVDDQGRVVDDGSAEMRPWVGMHYAKLPFTVTAVAGIDLRRVLGLDITEGGAGLPGNDEELTGDWTNACDALRRRCPTRAVPTVATAAGSSWSTVSGTATVP
jgi:hypothetical protein